MRKYGVLKTETSNFEVKATLKIVKHYYINQVNIESINVYYISSDSQYLELVNNKWVEYGGISVQIESAVYFEKNFDTEIYPLLIEDSMFVEWLQPLEEVA